jgi:DNA helicase-2/ATP-dependent DNA helicase PcrA
MDLLKNLNQPQRQAVTYKGGPLLVVSGPGAGKTRVLTHRVAWLISQGINPRNILAVTFTNKAASEMKQRIQALLTKSYKLKAPPARRLEPSGDWRAGISSQLWIGTFHSVCARILREQVRETPYQPNFLIYDRKDSFNLIKEISENLQINSSQFKPGYLLAHISTAKAEMITPDKAPQFWSEYPGEIISQVYKRYQLKLQRLNALDFDDLMTQAVFLFKNKPRILKLYQERFAHLLIDEYQDTNPVQYEFSKLLAKKSQNLTAVGDIDQSIYGFRNADFRNILNLQNDFPNLKIIKLEQNYRSTQNILKAADELIKENRERIAKTLWTQNNPGPFIGLAQVEDEKKEAQFILKQIEELIYQHRYNLKDFAILFRTNAQSRALEEALIRHQFPYRLIGTTRFYERAEIKDLLAYLRLLINPEDETAFRRIANRPPRGIGQKTLELLIPYQKHLIVKNEIPSELEFKLNSLQTEGLTKLAQLFKALNQAKTKKTLGSLVQQLVNGLEFIEFLDDGTDQGRDRAENVKEFLGVAKAFPQNQANKTLVRFLENVALLSEHDEVAESQDIIHLMTLHAAKGLEFPVIFIAGMEEGLLPHYRSLAEKDSLEEERRLCYVGMTRAKERLILSFAKRRSLYGRLQANPPSRFLFAIPEKIVEIITPEEN